MVKLENTRINLEGDFDSFKKRRLEEQGIKLDVPENNSQVESAKTESTEKLDNSSQTAQNEVVEELLQSELSLNEPPDEKVETLVETDWAHSVSETQLLAWWNEFVETQTVRIASMMRTLKPRIAGKDVIVTVPPKKTEMFEPVRFPFNRFITDKSDNKLTTLVIEAGEVTETERKPYTDKEKLEFLVKKHPQLDEVIKKLGLRIP